MGVRLDYLESDRVLKDSLIINLRSQVKLGYALDSVRVSQFSQANQVNQGLKREIWWYRAGVFILTLAVLFR